jgi:PD-(D/E)XK nuclease superfamily
MSKLESIKRYREHHGLNYSLLKNVIENNTKPFLGNIHSEMGSALDARVSLDDDEFFELYIIGEEDRPTGKLVDIVDSTFKRFSFHQPITKDFEYYLPKILEAAVEAKFGGKNKKIEKLTEEVIALKGWWEVLVKKQQYEYITQSELNYIDNVVHKLKTEEPGKFLFDLSPKFQIDIYGQVEVRGKMVDVKGLIDMLIELPDKLLLVDLKRTSYALDNWGKVVRDNKYLIQMSLYHDILKTIYPDKEVECYWLCVQGYDIRIFPVHETDLRYGRTGCKYLNGFYHDHTDEKIIPEIDILGYKDAIARLQDAKSHNLSDYNIEKFQNKGLYPKKSVFE